MMAFNIDYLGKLRWISPHFTLYLIQKKNVYLLIIISHKADVPECVADGLSNQINTKTDTYKGSCQCSVI